MVKIQALALVAPAFSASVEVSKLANKEWNLPNSCSLCAFDYYTNEYGTCFVPTINPRSYLMCDDGEPIKQDCPEETVWSQTAMTCVEKNDFNSGVCGLCRFHRNDYGSCYLSTLNPTEYVQCDNGDAVKRSCPEGLVWNQYKETCDWPRRGLADSSGDGEDRELEGWLNPCNLCKYDYYSTEYGTCFVPTYNPSKYLSCVDGLATTQSCPKGLVWNQSEMTCVEKNNYNNGICNICRNYFHKNEYGSCFISTLNPTKYIQCDNGNAVRRSCPEGLVWNQREEACDWPKWS